MVSRHVGSTRCGKSLMQGWEGRTSAWATHACPLRLPLSAGSLRLGFGRKENLAEYSTGVLLENAVFGARGELSAAIDVEHLVLFCESSR